MSNRKWRYFLKEVSPFLFTSYIEASYSLSKTNCSLSGPTEMIENLTPK
jgi:hypothetical protein